MAVLGIVGLFVTILVAVISAENRFVHNEQYRYDLSQLREEHNRDLAQIQDLMRDVRGDLKELGKKLDEHDKGMRPNGQQKH